MNIEGYDRAAAGNGSGTVDDGGSGPHSEKVARMLGPMPRAANVASGIVMLFVLLIIALIIVMFN